MVDVWKLTKWGSWDITKVEVKKCTKSYVHVESRSLISGDVSIFRRARFSKYENHYESLPEAMQARADLIDDAIISISGEILELRKRKNRLERLREFNINKELKEHA